MVSLSRLNWVSRVSNIVWRREGSGFGFFRGFNRFRFTFSLFSWLEEVEGREVSELSLGGGTFGVDLEFLDEREGSGFIFLKRILWRNWGRYRGLVSSVVFWVYLSLGRVFFFFIGSYLFF